MRFKDRLNGRLLFDEFGLVIQTGTEGLLLFPERKFGHVNDWREEDGKEYDMSLVRFQEKEVTLNCAIMASDDVEFWTYYNDFFSELIKEGYQTLSIHDHSYIYLVAYKKTSQFVKTSKRLKNVDYVFVKFRLTLIIKPDSGILNNNT